MTKEGLYFSKIHKRYMSIFYINFNFFKVIDIYMFMCQLNREKINSTNLIEKETFVIISEPCAY